MENTIVSADRIKTIHRLQADAVHWEVEPMM
jgi:hypothetical protein